MNACKVFSSRIVQSCLIAASVGLAACAPVKPEVVPMTKPPASTGFLRQGSAIVRVGVRADGTVAYATVTESAGDRELDQLAIDAAKKWPFGLDSVRGLAQGSLARVSMALDVPQQAAPGCPGSVVTSTNSNSAVRVVGGGLRGGDPADAQRAIYLTVLTVGCGWLNLSALWQYDGPQLESRLFNRTNQAMLAQGPATTVFDVKNPHPWPLGLYHVDIQVNGATVETRRFVIDRHGLSSTD